MTNPVMAVNGHQRGSVLSSYLRFAKLASVGPQGTKLYPMPVCPEGSTAVRDVEWLALSGWLRSRKAKAHAGETTRYKTTNRRLCP
jgi:hypothetical protein